MYLNDNHTRHWASLAALVVVVEAVYLAWLLDSCYYTFTEAVVVVVAAALMMTVPELEVNYSYYYCNCSLVHWRTLMARSKIPVVA